jgi:hypothetical protein
VKKWAPAFENYSFVPNGSATVVQVEMDCQSDWEGYMDKTWPRALARLKAICEAQTPGS